ncbi:VWA domain-containing protein, partial [Candidatus Woesearchaeota archaeon]
GYDPNSIERNSKIPEFQDLLKDNIRKKFADLRSQDLITKQGLVTPKGLELAAINLLSELDNYITKDEIGEKTNKKTKHFGERAGIREYRRGDRYKDISVRKSVRRAVRRGHDKILPEDLMVSEREGRGIINIILAIDSSASMKGGKIEVCKKAGVALAHRAISEKNNVGLVIFGSDVTTAIRPNQDFGRILHEISNAKVSQQTDFPKMIEKSSELFSGCRETKHLIILTDALPTVGDDPEKETLKAASKAKAQNITISVIGIKLGKEGLEIAKELTRIGEGRLNVVKQLSQVGHFVLQDYYCLK